MVILTLNCGSSSVKYQVYDWEQKNVLASGIVERVGQEGSIINHKAPGIADFGIEHECPNHIVAIELILKTITDPKHGVVKVDEGHRRRRPPHGPRRHEVRPLGADRRRIPGHLQGPDRPGPPAQPGQHHGRRGRRGRPARRAPLRHHGHRLAPDHARHQLPLRPAPANGTRSTRSGATASTAPASSTPPSAPPCSWARIPSRPT